MGQNDTRKRPGRKTIRVRLKEWVGVGFPKLSEISGVSGKQQPRCLQKSGFYKSDVLKVDGKNLFTYGW